MLGANNDAELGLYIVRRSPSDREHAEGLSSHALVGSLPPLPAEVPGPLPMAESAWVQVLMSAGAAVTVVCAENGPAYVAVVAGSVQVMVEPAGVLDTGGMLARWLNSQIRYTPARLTCMINRLQSPKVRSEQMSSTPEDPFVDMRRLFPLGPSYGDTAPQESRCGVVPFGIRYAVPSVVVAAEKNSPLPTKRRVSINAPTGTDGKSGTPVRTDDTPTEGVD